MSVQPTVPLSSKRTSGDITAENLWDDVILCECISKESFLELGKNLAIPLFCKH